MIHTHSLPVLEVSIKNCYNACELADLEHLLSQIPGVKEVHLDRTRSVAYLIYDPAETNETHIRDQLKKVGYDCNCQPCNPSAVQPGHPSLGQKVMGEIPSSHNPTGTGSAEHNDHAAMGHAMTNFPTPADHSAFGHNDPLAHDEHAGHGSPDDMLRRFVVSLLLTLPIVLFSAIGQSLGFQVPIPYEALSVLANLSHPHWHEAANQRNSTH